MCVFLNFTDNLIIFAEFGSDTLWMFVILVNKTFLKGFLIFCQKFEILQYFGDKLYSRKSEKIKIFKTAN